MSRRTKEYNAPAVFNLSPEQEAHLEYIEQQFVRDVRLKYRKGAEEHGGFLGDKHILELLDEAIQETVDQYTFLVTLREKLKLTLTTMLGKALNISGNGDGGA